jgi:hypothetical protein
MQDAEEQYWKDKWCVNGGEENDEGEEVRLGLG